MPIVRRKLTHDHRFTQIPNDWIRDPQVSLKARGLLALLLSHSEGWSVTVGSLARENRCGKDAIRGAVGELEARGYLVREQHRASGGEFSETYWFTSEPLSGSPLSENPTPVNPTPENPQLKKTSVKNTNSKKTKREKTWSRETMDEAFETFWSTYPRRVGKAAARRAFDKLAHSNMREILEGVARLSVDPNLPEIQFVPYPATWLNREGWLDEPYPDKRRAGSKITNAQRNLLDFERSRRGNGERRDSPAIGRD